MISEPGCVCGGHCEDAPSDSVCMWMYMYVHEQSYYIVHYIRRKEEGKEGRKKRTNNDSLKRLRKIYCTCT